MRLWLILAIGLSAASADTYTEDLVITKLQNGNFLSQFKFLVSSDSLDIGKEYKLFPRVIAELISQYSVKELSFSLGMGRWFSEEWGIPPQPSAPTGAYVHAWIEGNETEVDEKWRRVINSLNGIVCTSLTPVIPTLTSSPVHLAETTRHNIPGSLFRYAALAKETVCTENLTPWRKLFPCKQNGLTTLLNPLKLYDSSYHSMGLKVVQKENNWQLDLNLNVVAPQTSARVNEVDIETLFGRKIVGSCRAANKSSVWIEASDSTEVPLGGELRSGFLYLDVNNETSPKNPRVDLQGAKPPSAYPIISLSSKLGGVGDYTGRMVTMIINSEESRRVVFTHSIPWFVQIHYKTLELNCEQGGKNKKVEIHAHSFVPSISRKRPAVMEYEFDLPAKSQCQVTFDFKKAFLRLREYPPDSNHGMYVPSAILTVKNTKGLSPPGIEKNRGKAPITIHGNVLLVVLPVPDFSMPFNVICFVLTTITLCFGPIHNFSTKMLIPLNTKLPMTPTYRKILRVFLLVLLALALYAQYYEIGLNEIRRIIARAVEDVKEGFEKMNSM